MGKAAEIIEHDLRSALDNDRGSGQAMFTLADALLDRATKEESVESPRQLDEALQLLGRALSTELDVNSLLPYVYYDIARAQYAKGLYAEAMNSIDTAIAMKEDSPKYYKLWREAAEKVPLRDKADASCRLAAIYNHGAENKMRSGQSSAALDACWRSLETLVVAERCPGDVRVNQVIGTTMGRISQIVQEAGSKSKAIEFWKTVTQLESMKVLRDSANVELQILSKPQ